MARPLRHGEPTVHVTVRLPVSKMLLVRKIARDARLTVSETMVHILQGVAEGDPVDQTKVAELRAENRNQGAYIRDQERIRIAFQERIQKAERRLGAYKAKYAMVLSRMNKSGIEAAKRALRTMEREVQDLHDLSVGLNVGEVEADAAIRRLRSASVEVIA